MYYHCTDCKIYLREDLIEERGNANDNGLN